MNVITLVWRIINQMIRDKRTLALMMIAPLFILTLLHFLFETDNGQQLKVGVYQTDTLFNQQLENSELEVIQYRDDKQIEEKVKQDQLAAFISKKDNQMTITYEHSSPSDTAQVKAKVQGVIAYSTITELSKLVQTVMAKLPNQSMQQQPPAEMTITDQYIYGKEDSSFFDVISPIFVGFFVFFFVFLISGISLLRERTVGTLDRLLSTPIRRGEIVTGYLSGYGLFALIQTLIIVSYAVYVLEMEMRGEFALVILINIMIAFIALSLGMLLSTFANSEFQMVQFIPVAVIPQILFAGIIPVENMAEWLQAIAYVIPMYYGGDALVGVMTKGYTLADIQTNLGVLFLFAFVFTVLNVIGLRRYRKV